MKIKMKYIVAQACLVAGASIALTSCNDFLDREPLDQVTPQEYFQTADHLAAYTISKYNSMFSTHSGWNAGTVNNDGGTDNMVVGGYNSTYYEKGIWKVPQTMTTGPTDCHWPVIATTFSNRCCLNMKPERFRGQKMISNTTSVKCISCVP